MLGSLSTRVKLAKPANTVKPGGTALPVSST